MKYQTGGFPENGSLFIQTDSEQLVGSIFKGKIIPSTQEPINESIRQAVLQSIKEHVYGKTYN
nr:MAG TPA: hypothetical protein [Bacteriophage sp.]